MNADLPCPSCIETYDESRVIFKVGYNPEGMLNTPEKMFNGPTQGQKADISCLLPLGDARKFDARHSLVLIRDRQLYRHRDRHLKVWAVVQ